ncbi:TetR/AcrR family transcriptional regulator [Saccharothrix variisporea]|uniref:TetR family transcriptional regulator n=1 Tax=Saccharothrix variisporea TaxID=543527 RepID=A0A495XP54_9PSEU|nr:TetR/AcrR family transcriptional regulator [Saccharothrix variisporea]RKT74243.1 TetR family transcriptional regulator [Saccharothrix variisporea]
MPKVVDHEERRTRLTSAVWSLAVRDGLDGVTLRKVAAEAGVSMGQVQHYYPSMDVLVRDALDRSLLALNARIERSLTPDATPEEVLRRCLGALVAEDEETTRLLRFGAAVLGRAIADPTMARVLTPGDDALLAFTADLIAAARGSARDTDRVDADICWSLATSLGVDIALGHRTPEAARAVLDHQVDRVLRG